MITTQVAASLKELSAKSTISSAKMLDVSEQLAKVQQQHLLDLERMIFSAVNGIPAKTTAIPATDPTHYATDDQFGMF